MRGSLVVGAGILAGNITGFVRFATVAWFLGTRAKADALAVSVGPIDTLNGVVINTMLVSFVPMLMARRNEDRAAIFARASRLFAWILFAVSAVVFALAPQLISILGPGLAEQQHNEAVQLLRLLAPATFFGGCGAIFSALLYTERRFVVPALYQACLNGAMIAGAISLWKVMGVRGFALGYTLGAALHLLLTWAFSRDLQRAHRASGAMPGWTDILGAPALFLLYASLISANVLITRAFATHAGPGMAAAFDYCIRCSSVVIAYLVYPVANSLLPELARLRGSNNMQQANRLISKSIALMAIASVTSCLVGVALRTPIIALLFQRGSFTPESTLLVSRVFLGFAPSLIGWSLIDLVSRCCFAMDRPRLPILAACVPVTVNLAVMAYLGKVSDPALIGLGTSIGMLAGFLLLFATTQLRRKAANLTPEPVEV